MELERDAGICSFLGDGVIRACGQVLLCGVTGKECQERLLAPVA